MRIAKLKSNLLDRVEVESEFAAVVGAIKQVIMQSRLSKAEKADLFANLLTTDQFVNNVAQRQKADSTQNDQSVVANANGAIDADE
jgi:hypothetical protein